MSPREFYAKWKDSPEVVNGGAGVVEEITRILTWYFACKNTEAKADNMAVIRTEVLDFCAKHRWMRVLDVRQAIEDGKINDERNISATHILTLLSNYTHSEMRRQVMALLREELDRQIAAPAQASVDLRALLVERYDEYRRTGNISLGTGLIYTGFYSRMKTELGEDRLRELASEAFTETIKQFGVDTMPIISRELRVERDRQRKGIEDEWNRFLDTGKFSGGGLLRNAVRRKHLAAWFETPRIAQEISEKEEAK